MEEHGIIFTNLSGGLGNQLFQIFATIKFGLTYNMKIFFPDKYILDSKRHTYYHLFPDLKLMSNLPEIHFNNFDERDIIDDPMCNYFLNSCFQNLNNIEGINYLEYFKLPIDDEIYVNNLMKNLRSYNRPLISLHVRRGDFLEAQHWHKILDVDYYKNALNFLKHIENPLFLIFSEDKQWCIENLSFLDFVIVDEKDYIELFMMSKCDHCITANSTFSWWGAFLNKNQDKIVVYPFYWYQQSFINTSCLFPSSWKAVHI